MEEAINSTFTSKDLLAVYASGITALTAIISVVIAGFFNSYNQNKILKGTIHREDKKLKIEKIEQIYDSYTVWERKFDLKMIAIYAFQTGNMSYDEMRKETSDSDSKMGEALMKAEMLVSLHLGSKHSDKLKELLEIRNEVTNFLFIKEANKNNFAILKEKMTKFDKAATLFKISLAQEIKEVT